MNKQTEALNMAYKAEETGNLQDLVDAVNMLVEVVEALEQPAQEGISKMETTTPTIKESLKVEALNEIKRVQEYLDAKMYAHAYLAAQSCKEALEKDEQTKADFDVMAYGQSFMQDGKHIPLNEVYEWNGLSEEEFIYFTHWVDADKLSEIEKTFREKNYGKI